MADERHPVTDDPGTERLSIPPQYAALVERAAGFCPELTVPLVGAQIQTESQWDPNAVSPRGAQGIAQFMPATWREFGADHSGNGQADPFDPADAIPSLGSMMCRHIAEIRREGIAGDPVDLGLAAYNAGISAVKQYGGIPPYPETGAYIAKVRQLAESSGS
jgi:soluble lytic murein transglycosylase-like protein